MPRPRRTAPLAGLGLSLAALACAGPADRAAATPGEAASLRALADRYWERHLEGNPIEATYLGERRFDGRLPDLSAPARTRRAEEARDLRDALAAIDGDALEGQPRLTYLALEQELRREAAERTCGFREWSVDHREGLHLELLNVAAVQPVGTPEDGERLLQRWAGMSDLLDDHVANLRTGLERGRTPARVGVDRVLSQLDDLLSRPVEAWPLYAPAHRIPASWAPEERARFRDAVRLVIDGRIRPAFARLRDFLRDDLRPVARAGEAAGLSGLPGGDTCYEALVESFTTLELEPAEVHETGRRELVRIRERMRRVGARALGTDELDRIQTALRGDPALRFDYPEEIVEKAERATARAYDAMPSWFGRRPRAEVVVRPIPDYEAPHTMVAYYRQPAPDGSRPGIYYVNTYRPETRPRYEAEVLTFHEGIPGHHLQMAIAQELSGLPTFRRHVGATAFKEGWALYAEGLADEMGLYESDLDRLGLLSYDAWRASRLVVDTGIHAYGWTRERAADFLRKNTFLSEANIQNEVDRYITSPGQALSYKIGQLTISRLRAEAKQRLGPRFDIRTFHDRVLENGAVTLGALEEVVRDWIEAGAAP